MKNGSLLKNSIVASVLALVYPLLHPMVSNSQSRTYYCDRYRGDYSTFASSSQGVIPIILWANNNLRRCNEVSNRFQGALQSRNLRFLLKRGNEICGTDRQDGGCNFQLVVIDETIDPNSLIIRLFDRQNRVAGSYLFESSGGEQYFDLVRYLNETSLDQLLDTTPNN